MMRQRAGYARPLRNTAGELPESPGSPLGPSPLDEEYRRVLGRSARVWPLLLSVVHEDAYLVGGTALAMRLQHRQSYDLDVFASTPFPVDELRETIPRLAAEQGFTYSVERFAPGSMFCVVADTKLDLVYDTNALIRPPERISGMNVAQLEDIAAMKVAAATSRTALRDRYDLMLLQQRTGWSHTRCFKLYVEKYGWGIAPEVAARLCHWLTMPMTAISDPHLHDLDGNYVEEATHDYWLNQFDQLRDELSRFKRRTSPAGWPGIRQRREGQPRQPLDPPPDNPGISL